MKAVGLVGGLGFMLATMTVIGAWVGHALDARWGTTPWLTLAGTLGGMGAGFFEVAAVLKQVGKQS